MSSQSATASSDYVDGSTDTIDRELVITRLINASRERVFDAFMDGKTITHWWGPMGFTTTTHSQDKSVGGDWLFTMHGPDGTDYPNRVTYTEIARANRLRYNHDSGIKDDPNGFKVVINFVELGGVTHVELRMTAKAAAIMENMKKYGAIEGGYDTLSRLDAYLNAEAS